MAGTNGVGGRRLPPPGLMDIPEAPSIRIDDIAGRRWDLIDRALRGRCSSDSHPGRGGPVSGCNHPECVVRTVIES